MSERRKYRCSLAEPFGNVTVVTVEWDEPVNRQPQRTQVWFRDGKAKCCCCLGALVGMSGSCPHALAVKRFMRSQKSKKSRPQ